MAPQSNKLNFFRDLTHPWVKIQTFKDSSAQQWIDYSRRAQRHGSKPLAWVLDLDSTLFCVSGRLKRIFYEFLRESGPHPLWWDEIYRNLEAHEHRYGVRTTFREILKKSHSALARERAIDLWTLFAPYWQEKFFSNQHIAYDHSYEGAAAFVKSLYNIDVDIIYLTGRDVKRCQSGTYAALKLNQFPLGPRTRVLMKPHQSLSDIDYKNDVSQMLKAQYQVLAFLENEPENLQMFAKNFPDSEIIFFHSIMSPRLPQESYQNLLGSRSAWRMTEF